MANQTGRGMRGMVRQVWAWLTGRGYRPERHYMRGRRSAHGGVTAT